jgi:hypothetical protein
MATYSFLVFTRPTPNREDEYNHWYSTRHLADVLKVPSVVAAQRFKLSQPQADLPGPYLALYELETDDPGAVLAELIRRGGTQEMILSEALDLKTVSATLFAAITERLTAAADHS